MAGRGDRGAAEPLLDVVVEHELPSSKAASSWNVGPAIANFSVQYNLSCAGIAIGFMTAKRHRAAGADTADFPEPEWAQYALLGVVFVGAVVGMLVMGYLGDLLGRKRAMAFTLALNVIGALGSALSGWGSTSSIYIAIAVFRFVLGMGVGGIYPLSAVASAETSSEDEHSGMRVGWAFFWQTPGSMAPYVVALALLLMDNDGAAVTSLQFRLLFGLGAVPALAVLLLELRQPEVDSLEFEAHRVSSPMTEAFRHGEYWHTFVGTGLTWFAYDVSYYGTAIFTPIILQDIFGSSSSLLQISWQSLVVSSIGLPASISAIVLLKPKGARWLNMAGFLFIAATFATLGVLYELSPHGLKYIKFAAFLAVTFSLSFGPNVATFVLPATAYPPEVRSTFHGLSSASAKVGAVAGTFMYEPIAKRFGLPWVMWVQVAFALLGWVLSVYFIAPDGPKAGTKASSYGAINAPCREQPTRSR